MHKLLCLFYLDDSYHVTHKDREQAQGLKRSILNSFGDFGWVLASVKTTDLSYTTEVLGLLIDTVKLLVSVSSSRQEKFLRLLEELQSLRPDARVSARKVAKFAGYLVSMEQAAWYSQRLSYPFLYALKPVASSQSWDSSIQLTNMCREALSLVPSWWGWARGKPFVLPKPEKVLVSDSSSYACAGVAVLPMDFEQFVCFPSSQIPASASVYRMWRQPDMFHINWKELRAFLLTASAFLPSLTEVYIGAALDNTTALSYVKKGGGSVALLADVAWSISKLLITCRSGVGAIRT